MRSIAFRIHDRVVRGEIDNRVKGIVRGKIRVEGRDETIVLELKGNASPDLARTQKTRNSRGIASGDVRNPRRDYSINGESRGR